MPDLSSLLQRWRDDLAAWAIPSDITAAVADSPWVLPRQVFARRADRMAAAPSGPSYRRALAALDPPGSLLDVGSGAGAACLPLLPRVTSLTAVDTDAGMLELLSKRASAAGIDARTVLGSWPQSAPQAGPADVVTCHHVTYNVADIGPFVLALTSSARHHLRRPEAPTAADLLEILEAMGLRPGHEGWTRQGGQDYASFAELADVTRRRLCLPRERTAEVARALVESGADPQRPMDLGSSGRDVVTIWWDGTSQSGPGRPPRG